MVLHRNITTWIRLGRHFRTTQGPMLWLKNDDLTLRPTVRCQHYGPKKEEEKALESIFSSPF
jgi:hypothetical protein